MKTVDQFTAIADHPVVREAVQFYSELMDRQEGATWKELNIASQQLMDDYAGIQYVRSASMLQAGLTYLTQLEAAARQSVKCSNAHELMRALEAFDLVAMGKLVMLSALERKESRGMHKRSDYTFTNPLLNDMFVKIQQIGGKPVTSWRKAY